jgi:hypothetical protein
VIWDASDLLESQIAAVRDLPHGVPALVVISMKDRDLAHLDAAADTPHYQSVLRGIVRRIESDRKERN